MKTNFSRRVLVALLLALTSSAALADVITGTPPLSSIAGGPFDNVNLANLNVHFSIPIFSKAGKGLPFFYNLTYDSLIWSPTAPDGSSKWTPATNWGWTISSDGVTGYVTYGSFDWYQECPINQFQYGENISTYGDWTYHDSANGTHSFPGTVVVTQITSTHCGTIGTTVRPITNALTSDNSGYTVSTNSSTWNGPSTVKARGGLAIVTPYVGMRTGAGSVTDANNNVISINSTGTIFDTLGLTTLIISGSPPTRNCESSPVQYEYSAPGGPATVTVSYRTYTVQTDFGVGIPEFPATNECLVDKVTLPDTSFYQFTYETAYGLGSNVTGRIAQITLPTGGTIAYSYNGSPCHYRCNAMMTDGSPSFMYRTLGGGLWSYYRGYQSGSNHPLQTTTAVVDPASNETDLKFSSIYETERKVYQGSSSQNQVLDYSYTCYNGNTNDSTCPAAVVTPPIASRGHNDHANQITFGVPYSSVWDYYDTYGNLTKETDYTFASPPTLIRTVTNHYNGCTPNNICNELANSQTTDGGGASKSYTTYAYDQGGITHGKVTTISRSTTGSTSGPFLSQGYTYDSHGIVQTATDSNGTVTSYHSGGYSCNSAFPNQISVGGLTTSYGYNCSGGVVTSVTDPNNRTATISYTVPNGDPYYWRPSSSSDQSGNVTYYNYYRVYNSWVVDSASQVTVPGQAESVMEWISNGGCCDNTTNDNLSTPDAYNRPFLQQKRQSTLSSTWDTTQVVFDASGRVQQTSLPFSAAAGPHAAYQHLSITGYDYDNLGRYTDIFTCNGTDCYGPNTSFSYNANDVKTVAGSGSGGQTFGKQLEYDVLGRVTSVCELSNSLHGVGGCGQNTNPGMNGYRTAYTYDPLGDLLSVNQSGQTRGYVYDGLSRMTAETNPESGTKTYTFDNVAAGYCAATVGAYSSPGDLVATADANGNHVCSYYDGLHRLTAVGNNQQSATNVCHRFRYDNPNNGYKGPPPAGISPAYTMGRIVETATDNCGAQGDPLITDEWLSYSPRGEDTDLWESTPHSGAYYHVQQEPYANGAIASMQGFVTNAQGHDTAFSHSFGFAEDGEGRPAGYWDVTLNNLDVSGAVYNVASQPTHVGLIYGEEDFTYEPYAGRMATWDSYTGPNNDLWNSGTLYWNLNGTLELLDLRDSSNPASDETCGYYTYDDLGRLTSDNCGSVWNQNFNYDQWGNINKTGPSGVVFSSQGGSGNHVPGFSYDAVGDVTFDGLHHYAYDVYGHPITVDGITTTFDALGRAVEKNGTEQIVYSPNGGKFAYMNGSSLGQYMVPMVAGMVAVYLPDPTGLHHFRHVDWLGSVRFDSTPSGTVWYDGAYAPFGENYVEAGTPARSFTGQTQDTLTDTYDFLMREENKNQGRWETPDPAGLGAVNITDPQTWNRYAYVANRPLSNVDPQGLYLCDSGDDDDESCNGGGDEGDGGGGGGDYGGGGDNGGGDNGCAYDACVVAPPPPDVPPEEIPLPDSIPDDSGDGLLPGSVSIDDPWPKDQPATAPTCFFYYGNYGGPCYTGGQWTPLETMTPEQQANLPPPVDEEDACYQSHDYCYSNSRVATGTTYGSSPTQAQTNAENFMTGQCDLVVAACLSNLPNVSATGMAAEELFLLQGTYKVFSYSPLNSIP